MEEGRDDQPRHLEKRASRTLITHSRVALPEGSTSYLYQGRVYESLYTPALSFTLIHEPPRRLASVLKNPFVPFCNPCSEAENPVL